MSYNLSKNRTPSPSIYLTPTTASRAICVCVCVCGVVWCVVCGDEGYWGMNCGH
jgi:hypothetical protein